MQELILLYHDEADECFQGALLIFFQIEICGEKQEWVEIILNNLGRLLFKGFEKSQAVRGKGI